MGGPLFRASVSMASGLWLGLHCITSDGSHWVAPEKIQKCSERPHIVLSLWPYFGSPGGAPVLFSERCQVGLIDKSLEVCGPVSRLCRTFEFLKHRSLAQRHFSHDFSGASCFWLGGKCYQNILFGTRKCRGNGKQK